MDVNNNISANSIYTKAASLGISKEQLNNSLTNADTDNNNEISIQEYNTAIQTDNILRNFAYNDIKNYSVIIASASVSETESAACDSKALEPVNISLANVFNLFAVSSGRNTIPEDVMQLLATKLRNIDDNFRLDFKPRTYPNEITGGIYTQKSKGEEWVDNEFASYGEDIRKSIVAALKGIANCNDNDKVLSLHDIGNAQTAVDILSQNGNNLTTANVKIIQTAIDDNRFDNRDNNIAANQIIANLTAIGVNIGINASDVEDILNQGDTNNDGRLYDNQIDNARIALNNIFPPATLSTQTQNSLLEDTKSSMGTTINTFATSEGYDEIPEDALQSLMTKLANEDSLLKLDFSKSSGADWVDSNFSAYSSKIRDSIKAALKGISNTNMKPILTMSDIGNAWYATAILSKNNNVTAKNITIIQTLIDDNRFDSASSAQKKTGNINNTNNINCAIQIAAAFKKLNVDLGMNVSDIIEILNIGDKDKDGRLYDDQIDAGVAALYASAAVRKALS